MRGRRSLICTVNSHVNVRILLNITEHKASVDNKILRLEACAGRGRRPRKAMRANGPVGMKTLGAFTSLPCFAMRSTTYGTVDPARPGQLRAIPAYVQ